VHKRGRKDVKDITVRERGGVQSKNYGTQLSKGRSRDAPEKLEDITAVPAGLQGKGNHLRGKRIDRKRNNDVPS